jgi:probable phosphoglycerate mutase
MTTFLLIRHAAHAAVAHTLVGRLPGVTLSAQGQAQAQQLAARLAPLPIAAIYSSPQARALQTAQPLAARLRLDITCSAGLDEIDFGEWAGQQFEALAPDVRWQAWNQFRSGAPLPDGGLMLQVQSRAVTVLAELHRQRRDQTVVLVSHSDVIKAVIAHYLGTPLDLLQRIEISPASVSVLALHDWGAQIVRLNDTGELA